MPLVLCAVLAVLGISCGSDDPTGPDLTGIRHLIVSPSSPVYLSPGRQLPLHAAALDSNGLAMDIEFSQLTWASDKPGTAKVNGEGIVTAMADAVPGTRVVVRGTAHADVFSSVEIVIVPQPVEVSIDPASIIMTPGGDIVLIGRSGDPQGIAYDHQLFRFTSSNQAVATVLKTGCFGDNCIENANITVVHGIVPGTSIITAQAAGLSSTSTIEVRQVSFVPSTVSAGGSQTCAFSTDGVLFCWGSTIARTPIGVPIPAGMTQVQSGTGAQPFDDTCGIDAAGLVQCWAFYPIPRLITPVSTTIHFNHLAVGSSSSCGIDTNGDTWCWGENAWGQLGNGTKTASVSPVQVLGGHVFVRLAVHGFHACGLTAVGAAYCWGSNLNGELGSPGVVNACAPYDCSTTPQAVSGGHVFSSIVAGSYHTCAIDDGGAAWCWGAADKRGNGGTPTAEPSDLVLVSGNHTWGQVTAGSDHTCGVTDLDQGYCWGANPDGRSGQIPTVDPGPFLTPNLIIGGHSFTHIEAGGGHTCAFASDGLYCFGENAWGQVGIVTQNAQSPVKVNGQP